jgi:hypothetical protein
MMFFPLFNKFPLSVISGLGPLPLSAIRIFTGMQAGNGAACNGKYNKPLVHIRVYPKGIMKSGTIRLLLQVNQLMVQAFRRLPEPLTEQK